MASVKSKEVKEEREASKEELLIAKLQAKLGANAIMSFSDRKVEVDSISTACPSLDLALGIGGVPKGKIVEIFGEESVGRSSLCSHITASAQKAGDVVAYLDLEHALDPVFMTKLGVDIKRLMISQPESQEDALNIVETLLDTKEVGLIIIDSVAAMTPRVELAGEIGESHMGVGAKLMSQALRKLTPKVDAANSCLIFINQLRDKMATFGFESKKITTGGKSLKFYSSIRMEMSKKGSLKDGEEVIGNRIRVKVVKNKCASPFREAEFDLLFGQGISREGDIIDLALKYKVLQKAGAWFSYNSENIGQGREKTRNYLVANPEIAEEILSKTLEVAMETDSN